MINGHMAELSTDHRTASKPIFVQEVTDHSLHHDPHHFFSGSTKPDIEDHARLRESQLSRSIKSPATDLVTRL
jgi:hypothetical protein